MPTAGERLIWGFGTEKDTKVVKASFPVVSDSNAEQQAAVGQQEITLSSAICWENMMVSCVKHDTLLTIYTDDPIYLNHLARRLPCGAETM